MGIGRQPKPYHSYREAHRSGFWAKVKVRKVFPFLGIFLAFGFLALEGVDQLISHEALPDGFYWLALVLYLFGIPGTIFLAWFHGESGPQKPCALEYWLHGSLLAGAALAVFLFLPEPTPGAENGAGAGQLQAGSNS
jgi:fatty acid desaturase